MKIKLPNQNDPVYKFLNIISFFNFKGQRDQTS